jgi:hypothetical protein
MKAERDCDALAHLWSLCSIRLSAPIPLAFFFSSVTSCVRCVLVLHASPRQSN